MIFRQLFDSTSSTYTYLLASRKGGEALIIDPVLERVDRYIQLLRELDLKLIKAVDTHVHADHITGLGKLRDLTHCITVMGEQSGVDVVSMRVSDGDRIDIEGLSLDVLYTPGHTDDSYSFILPDRVFTGDTLLIRGTGRTDFQNGNPRAQYDSIFNRLLKLPDQTLVYPAHDYKGDTVSTIAEEKAWNPRLQVKSLDEYVELMNNLHLPNPKMMDVAVPANLHMGLAQDAVARRGWALLPSEARAMIGEARIAKILQGARGRPALDVEALAGASQLVGHVHREHRGESELEDLEETMRDAPAPSLSGGERRRVEIARALATRPSFMLLDEPFAGIDPLAITDIRDLIRFLRERGIGILITDHNVRETLEITDRATIIHEGEVLFEGSPAEIRADPDVRRVYLGESFA